MKRLFLAVVALWVAFLGFAHAQFPPRHIALGDWLMLHGSLGHNGFSALKGSITTWNVKYSISAGEGESQPAVGDANGDGIPDIVFVNWFNCTVRSYNGSTGSLQWMISLGGSGAPNAPAMADLIPTSPGLEIVVSCGSALYLLRGTDGSLIWVNSYGGFPAPAVAFDGPDTLIISSDGANVYALRPNGTLVWSATAGGTTYHSASPAIGDIDGDGRYEVVVYGNDGYVRAYRFSNGAFLWSRYVGSPAWSGVSLGDINGDCIDEVIVANSSRVLYTLRGTDGSTIWTYSLGAVPAGPISVADINGDRINDIIVGLRNISNACVSGVGITVLSGTGTPLWSNWGWTPNAMHGGGRIVADFDGDGQLEIAGVPYSSWCSGDGTFRMFNALTGTLEWTYPYGVDAEGASMADVDGDMCAELMLLPSCCGSMNIVVLDGPGTGCGFYPYNDTCGVLGYDDPVNVGEVISSDKFGVEGGKGGLFVNGEGYVVIYDNAGSKRFEGFVKGNRFVRLNKGIYYVKVGGGIRAVVVK
ncbi:MAG: FG-GAP-like repeat-containing protein [candidate division WOR-3 bacterium]